MCFEFCAEEVRSDSTAQCDLNRNAMTPGQDMLVAWTYHCSMFTTEFLSGFEPPLDLYMFFHFANCNVDEGQWTAHTYSLGFGTNNSFRTVSHT